MKKNSIIIMCLMLMMWVVVGISFTFLNDIVPIHFGADGNPDQYGSKYFILLFPGIGMVIGLTMLLVAKYGKVSENYQKYLLATCIILETIFFILTVVFVVYAMTYLEETPAFDISKIMMVVIGSMFIIMSNFMPKIEKNRTLGIKTTWSMYNEVTWQKTHRFAGFMGVVVGVLMLASGIFFADIVNAVIFIALLSIFMITTTIASYKFYKAEKAK